jgi:hippurate hydrolase
MMFLGATPTGQDPRRAPANHSTRVYFEEDAMAQGIALYAALALRHLGASTTGR